MIGDTAPSYRFGNDPSCLNWALGCYFNGSLNACGTGKVDTTKSTSFSGQINKDTMMETLNTGSAQTEWNGQTTNIWKTTTENDGYPILYWE